MKKKFAILMRGYKTINRIVPKYLAVCGARAVFGAVQPFIAIFASAMILDALAAGAGLRRVLFLAILAAGIGCGTKLIMDALVRWRNALGFPIWTKNQLELNKKQHSMDYEQIDDPTMRMKREKVATLSRTNGMGIQQLSMVFEEMITNILGVIVSIGSFAAVFATSSSAAAGFWSFMNTAWFSVIFAAAIVGNALFNMLLATRGMKMVFATMQKMLLPNALGNFLLEKIATNYQMGKDMKVYDMSGCVEDIARKHIFAIGGVFAKQAGVEAKYQSVECLASGVLSAIVYIFVTVKAVMGSFGIGSVVQYVGGITRFTTCFMGMALGLARTFGNIEALTEYFEFLDTPPKIHHGTLPVEKRDDFDYQIEFCDVSFCYPGSDKYVLRHLNLKINIGQRMAVVGMNGSGKTTMIKLLCRLYDPTEGEIRLNGIDIRKYDYAEYMGVFSVVFQDFKLFSFPLGQNVAGSTEYDPARARDALHKAGLDERLARMPKGLETALYKDFEEEGIEISGGEAQKIAIARALYKGAPFIVLDEPTAALDPIAEAEIYSTLNDIVGEKTAIFISHRLSSCRFCHDIAVFHEGRLIQRGSHEALLADERGKYAEMWHAQAQYYDGREQAAAG